MKRDTRVRCITSFSRLVIRDKLDRLALKIYNRGYRKISEGIEDDWNKLLRVRPTRFDGLILTSKGVELFCLGRGSVKKVPEEHPIHYRIK